MIGMFRRAGAALALLVALALAASPAGAISARKLVVLTPPCPGVVLKASNVCAAVDVNLTQQWAWVKGQGFVPLTSLLSITRASQETVAWSDTHLSYAANNTLALAGLGSQVWESRTNLLLQSQAFQTTWTPTNIFDTTFATTTNAPDLTNTAQKLTENTTNGQHRVQQSITKAASALPYTLTLYALQAERTRIAIECDDGTNGGIVVFDLAGGQVGVAPASVGTGFTSMSGSVSASANGFYRVTFSFTTNTSTTLRTLIWLDAGSGTAALNNSYAGTNGQGAYIWGAQLEQAAFASPYIPTTTGTATRAADNVTPVGALLTALNSTAASIFASLPNGVPQAGTVLQRASSPNDAYATFSGTTVSRSLVGGSGIAPATLGSGTTASAIKVGHSHDGTGISNVANNGTVATSASTFGALDGNTHIGSKDGSLAGTFIDSNLSRLSIWNLRVPDTALKGLTQ